RCTGDSGVESHAQRNLPQLNQISATGGLALLPTTDFGREHHPTDLLPKRKPASIFRAAIEFHFGAICFRAGRRFPNADSYIPTNTLAPIIALALVAVHFEGGCPAPIFIELAQTARNRSSSGEPS